MNQIARQLSLTLESVSKAVSEWAVSRQQEMDGSLSHRYGDGWRGSWVAETQSRVRHLAQAIAVRRPRLFTETVAWSASAYRGRGMGIEDLANNLRALREVIESELPEPARGVVVDYLARAETRLASVAHEPGAKGLEPDRTTGELALRYLEALMSGERTLAQQLILGAVESGMSVREIYREVLRPAQREMGRMWHEGEISVADEHLATETTGIVMSMLRPHFDPVPPKDRRVVAAAVGGELHALGVRMVADFFEMDGWEAIYLGANMPREDVVRSLRDYAADLLAVSATSHLHLRAVGELLDAVRAEDGLRQVKIMVGGAPFNLVPDLWEELGADGSAPSADEAVALGNRLVGSS